MAIAFGYAEIIALSQTGIQAAESAYLAGSACQLQAAWFDADRNPYVPLALSYRLDAFSGMKQILGWTSIVPAVVNLVAITSAQNAMINATRESEAHQALFQITGQDQNVSFARVVFRIARTLGAS